MEASLWEVHHRSTRVPIRCLRDALVVALVSIRATSALADDASRPGAGSAPATRSADPGAVQLANQANNPNALLTQFQLRNVTAPRLPGFDGTGNTLQLQGIVPIKAHEITPFPLIMKLIVPVVTAPSPVDQTALGETQFFIQGVHAERWGSWGIGVTVNAPTATFRHTPKGTWQLGPAAAVIYTGVQNLVLGGVFQNPVSISTPSGSTGVSQLLFTPSATYTLPGAWFVGYSDYDWTFDWKNNGAATIPVGLQVGRVVHIRKQAFSLSAEAGYNAVRPADGTGVPRWMLGVELTALFPAL